MLQDVLEVAIGHLQEFHEKMFDFDVVMRAGEAKARGGFQRRARGFIQLANKPFKLGATTCCLLSQN